MPGYINQVILQGLLAALPLFIIWIVGLVVAIIQLKKNPKSGIFTLLGIPVIGLAFLLDFTWNTFGLRWINTSPEVWRMARTLLIVIPLAINLIRAGGWVLILLAIFSQPKKKIETPAIPEEQSSAE